jgi:hypothetical protein
MRRAPLLAAPILCSALLACTHTADEREIVLEGYTAANYAALDAALGAQACVVGELRRDVTGVRFLLQPYEENGVLTPSPSRVMLRFERGTPESLRDGQRVRVCGTLEDATPWQRCDRNDCRWYALEDARLS